MSMSIDNRLGLILCNQLLTCDLKITEKEFVSNIIAQILIHPMRFNISTKQRDWLHDIRKKYIVESQAMS